MVQSLIESKKPKVKGKANVAFIIDVTASMQGCIDNLKSSLLALSGEIATKSTEEYGVAEPDISYSAMGYRDLTTDEPDEYKVVRMDGGFTPSTQLIASFFEEEKMQAAGGGDEPESTLDALVIAARELEWDQSLRLLVLFTDASTKKTLHPTTTGGTALNEEDSLNIVKEELLSKKIRVMIFGPPDIDEYMKVGSLNSCRYMSMEKIGNTLQSFSDTAAFNEDIIKCVAASVSLSASQPVAYEE